MIKPDSLRLALTAAIPELKVNPDRLQVFIDKGRVVSTGRPAAPGAEILAAFEYRYRLNLLILDYAGHPDVVFAVILAWLADNQRDLLDRYVAGAKDGIPFEADILDPGKADFSIDLELSERVGVSRDQAGVLVYTHWPEPVVENPLEGHNLVKLTLGDFVVFDIST